MPSNFYVLTPTAKQHLREAKTWSLARWGNDLTTEYFYDLEKAAVFLAKNYKKLAKRKDLTGSNELGIYPVREHYIVYVPYGKEKIAIVSVIRQGRDIPALLNKHSFLIQRELLKLKKP